MLNATLIPLQSMYDTGRGTLSITECRKDIPFDIKRVFYVYNLSSGIVRGQHAHRTQEQFITCLNGCIELLTVGHNGENSFNLSHLGQGVYLPPMTWVSIKVLDSSTIYLVVASGSYDESDYIRNYQQFETLLSNI